MPDFVIDTSVELPPLRRLNGVNNGPLSCSSLIDVTDYFKIANIPLVRTHDTNWPHAREVDIHTLFPDFNKDPSDPASYDFEKTDIYLQSILNTGASIVYRLGESIEWTDKKFYVHPPTDFEKWAHICVGVIRHYNQGWANGFHHNIKYWEIWNEADIPNVDAMWSGTAADYFELYATTARLIKATFPDVFVGGPAAAMRDLPWVREFLAFCRAGDLPLDFFSWHTYDDDPQVIIDRANLMQEWLEEFGYGSAESHLNEYNIGAHPIQSPLPMRVSFLRLQSGEGAAFTAGVLSGLQDTTVAQGCYYDARATAWYCGLFDEYGLPRPTYHVFTEFAKMCGFESRLGVDQTPDTKGVFPISVAAPEVGIRAWFANSRGEPRKFTIAVPESYKGQSLTYTARLISDAAEGAQATEFDLIDGELGAEIPRHSVLLIEGVPTR